ncbi:MAG: DUF2786 domain-containing protein [Vulcanimicrobiaceae bacterium]
MIEVVRSLLLKAKSSTFPAEARTFRENAERLMAKHHLKLEEGTGRVIYEVEPRYAPPSPGPSLYEAARRAVEEMRRQYEQAAGERARARAAAARVKEKDPLDDFYDILDPDADPARWAATGGPGRNRRGFAD